MERVGVAPVPNLTPAQQRAGLHKFLYDWVTGMGTLPPERWAWDELGGPQSERAVAPPSALAHLVDALVNDLEPAAEHVEPRLAPFRADLEAAAGAPALLAGSGSACWIAFDDADACERSARRVEAELSLPVHRGATLPSRPGVEQ